MEGTLCGFDPFMNLVLDDSIEFTKQVCRPLFYTLFNSISQETNCSNLKFDANIDPQKTQNKIGMVVIRGNSVVMLEARDRI